MIGGGSSGSPSPSVVFGGSGRRGTPFCQQGSSGAPAENLPHTPRRDKNRRSEKGHGNGPSWPIPWGRQVTGPLLTRPGGIPNRGGRGGPSRGYAWKSAAESRWKPPPPPPRSGNSSGEKRESQAQRLIPAATQETALPAADFCGRERRLGSSAFRAWISRARRENF